MWICGADVARRGVGMRMGRCTRSPGDVGEGDPRREKEACFAPPSPPGKQTPPPRGEPDNNFLPFLENWGEGIDLRKRVGS